MNRVPLTLTLTTTSTLLILGAIAAQSPNGPPPPQPRQPFVKGQPLPPVVEPNERRTRDRGTVAYVSTLVGDAAALTVANHFADLFPLIDPSPADRIRHFTYPESMKLRRTGWRIDVIHVHGDEASHIIEVTSHPSLVSTSASTYTSDRFTEYYSVNPLGIRYLGGHPTPGVIPAIFGD